MKLKIALTYSLALLALMVDVKGLDAKCDNSESIYSAFEDLEHLSTHRFNLEEIKIPKIGKIEVTPLLKSTFAIQVKNERMGDTFAYRSIETIFIGCPSLTGAAKEEKPKCKEIHRYSTSNDERSSYKGTLNEYSHFTKTADCAIVVSSVAKGSKDDTYLICQRHDTPEKFMVAKNTNWNIGRSPRIKSVDNVLQIFSTANGEEHLTVKRFTNLAQIPIPTKADMENQEDYKNKFENLNFKDFKFKKGDTQFDKIVGLKEYKKSVGGEILYKSRTGGIMSKNTKELIISAKKDTNGLIAWKLDKVSPFKTVNGYTFTSNKLKIFCREESDLEDRDISRVLIMNKFNKNEEYCAQLPIEKKEGLKYAAQ